MTLNICINIIYVSKSNNKNIMVKINNTLKINATK